MRLLYASYKNIWPLENKLVSLRFLQWKYLIKAPIGTGKSFMFFDGPVFWLYKYSQRTIINRSSEQWFVKILVEVHGTYLLIIRDIKQTKAGGDSVQTRLFLVQTDALDELFDDMLVSDLDIQHILESRYTLDEQIFKSQQELQDYILSLLPPKELFLTTTMLMQDSFNIFELGAAERIQVFKHLFNLLSIDDGKDILADHKRFLQAKVKALWDTSMQDKKLTTTYQQLVALYQKFQSLQYLQKAEILGESFNAIANHLDEIGMMLEHLRLSESNFLLDYATIFDQSFQNIQSRQQSYATLKSSLDLTKEQLQQTETQISSVQKQKHEISNHISLLEKELTSFDESAFSKLKQSRADIYQQQQNFLKDLDINALHALGYSQIHDIIEVQQLISDLTQQWKTLKERQTFLDAQKRDLESKNISIDEQLLQLDLGRSWKASEQIEQKVQSQTQLLDQRLQNIDVKISHYNTKLQSYEENLAIVKKKVQDYDKTIDKESIFHCDKINADCPYITVIKKSSLEIMNHQKASLEKESESIHAEMQLYTEQNSLTLLLEERANLVSQKEQIQQNPLAFFPEFVQDIQNQCTKLETEQKTNLKKIESLIVDIKEIETKLDEVKVFFQKYDWKKAQNAYQEYKVLGQQIHSLDQELTSFEKSASQISSKKEEIITQKQSLIQQEKLLLEYHQSKDSLTNKIQELSVQEQSYDIQWLQSIQQILQSMQQAFDVINHLYQDAMEAKYQLKDLQEQEKMTQNLHNIFSKELLLLVLQEFLPQLGVVMNNWLAQIVDFEVKRQIITTSTDKLELDISIVDQMWERPIKSLSWWQKTILKLVWIISIAILVRAKFLFLDETINSLDPDAVSKVSSMLQDFVKQYSLSFYVVTHSQQIQEMNIWDNIIELKTVV